MIGSTSRSVRLLLCWVAFALATLVGSVSGIVSVHRLAPARPPRGLRSTVVVVRTTSAKKSLAYASFWANLAVGLSDKGIDLVVSVDVTPENETLNCLGDWRTVPAAGDCFVSRATRREEGDCDTIAQEQLLSRHPGLAKLAVSFLDAKRGARVGLHAFSDEDLRAGFPAIVEADARTRDMLPHPLGWGYQSMADLLLWRLLRAKNYSSLWIFHDDTTFADSLATVSADANDIRVRARVGTMTPAGVVSRLIQLNERDTSGLLVMEEPEKIRPLHWMWTEGGSDAYLKATYVGQPRQGEKRCLRYATTIRAARFSGALLDEMERWCGSERCCGWVEMFPTTVAKCAGFGVGVIRGAESVLQDGNEVGSGYCPPLLRLALGHKARVHYAVVCAIVGLVAFPIILAMAYNGWTNGGKA